MANAIGILTQFSLILLETSIFVHDNILIH